MTDAPEEPLGTDDDFPTAALFDSTAADMIDAEAGRLTAPPQAPGDYAYGPDHPPDDYHGDDDPYYGPPPLPTINVDDYNAQSAYALCCEALVSMAFTVDGLPTLMVKDRRMVQVEDDTQLSVEGARLTRLASQVVRCIKPGRGQRQLERPLPLVLRESLELDPPHALPPLRAVVTHPVLAGDRLHSKSGYDKESQIWVSADADVPADMSAEEAVAFIDEALIDVPFSDGTVTQMRSGESVRGGDRASAYAAILTPLVRYDSAARDGRLEVPLWLVDKAAPGTGATTLVRLVSLISTGRLPLAQRILPPDDEELRKAITSILLDGSDGMVIFDNADRLVGDSLAKLLTDGGQWSDRRLGSNDNLSLTHNILWAATGNNPTIEQQLQRRTLPCRLHVSSERPDLREVQHGNPEGWVRDNILDLRRAVASLVQRWLDAGRPMVSPSWGSYQEWGDRIGGILQVSGIQGFGTNRGDMTARSDDTSVRWATLMHAMYEKYEDRAWGPGQAITAADDVGVLPPWNTNAKSDVGLKRAVTYALQKVTDRVWAAEGGGTYMLTSEANRKLGYQYRVIATRPQNAVDGGVMPSRIEGASPDDEQSLPPNSHYEASPQESDERDF